MKLSSDLKMFRSHLKELRNDKGELLVSAKVAGLMDLVLTDCIDMAHRMEVYRVQRPVTLVDLSDPKIILFPIVPSCNPVKVPIATPDDDGAA